MKKIIQIISAGLITLFGTIFSAKAQFNPSLPNVRTGKLSNGLTYYIVKCDKPRGRANFYLAQKVGSVLEEESQRGLAHFLEHMAFNGTTHFPGNTMISELEKKGIKFGSNLNAFTSYDETEYMITDVPLTRQGIIDTALLVLHDWSGCITNYDKDIEEERGVIREEWRTRSSGYSRTMENVVYPAIFAGSPYANRVPIGLIDVINNCKPQEIRDYYKKWYRPDLQGIIIVGDINPEQIEAKLKTLFADIPAPVNAAKRNYSVVPDNAKPIIVLAADPEMLGTNVSVYLKKEDVTEAEKSSKEYFKQKIINGIISNMLNQRLFEAAKVLNPPFKSAMSTMSQFSLAAHNTSWLTTGAPNGDDIPRALEGMMSEVERVERFGFNKDEMDNLIPFNLQMNETNYADRNSLQTFQISHYYLEQFLHSRPIIDPEWEYTETKKIFGELSIDTLNYYSKKYFNDKNEVVVITTQKKEILPAKETVMAILEKVKTLPLTRYVKPAKTDDLSKLDPVAGKIIKTTITDFGFTEWTLSNGARVRFKNTHYPEEMVSLYGNAKGGYSLVPLEDLPSALAISRVANLTNFSGGEGMASVRLSLDKESEDINVSGTVKYLKVIFQQAYAKMTGFKKEQEVFDNWKQAAINDIVLKAADPKTAFGDTLASIMRNHSPRGISLDYADVLAKVDYDKVIAITKARFADASGFTFFITGNINEDSIKPLVEKWLASLPSLYLNEKMVDNGMYPPKGVIKRHLVQKMKIPQTTVTIGYTGEMPLTIKNQVLMDCMSGILSAIYITEMREKEGGTYGASVSGQISKYPTERFIFQVNFDCNPDKKDRLRQIAYDEIRKISEQNPNSESLDKVKQNLLKDHEVGAVEYNCRYVFRIAAMKFLYGMNNDEYLKAITSITPAMVQAFAKEIVGQGNLIEVVMDPAK